jgi:hypothetical protein
VIYDTVNGVAIEDNRCRCEFTEGTRVGIHLLCLGGKRFLHVGRLHSGILALSRQEPKHCHLIVFDRLETQLSLVGPVRDKALVQLGDLKRFVQPIGRGACQVIDQVPK